MICPRCGKEIQLSGDSRFCPGCGLEFQRAPEPKSPTETNCPNCNAVIQPDAKFCPMCGKEIIAQPQIQPPSIQNAEYPTERYNENSISATDDIQVQLAQKELATLKKETNSGKALLYATILLALSVMSFCFKLYFGGIFFGIVFIAHIISDANKRNRKQEVEHLAAGQKILNVCPRCKSPDIDMSMVQTGGFTTHGTTRVADNINPLHPFTHTNVKKGNDYTSYSYGNQCHCRNCGNVFAKPEVHYM